jgi:hypothetical protein
VLPRVHITLLVPRVASQGRLGAACVVGKWMPVLRASLFVKQVDSVNRHGCLLQVVQLLTDLDLVITKAYISSDGGWFVDGKTTNIFANPLPHGNFQSASFWGLLLLLFSGLTICCVVFSDRT